MCSPFTWRPGLNRTLWRRLFDEPKRGLRLTAAKRWLLIVIVASVCFILYYSHKTQTRAPFYGFFRHIPEVTYQCPTLYSTDAKGKQWKDHSAPATRAKIDPKVLLFVETTFSKLGRDIQELLVHNRMKYKLEVAGSALPMMTNGGDKGRFGVIVFENYTKYLHMDKWNKELIDKYCKEFNVGILGFMPSEEVTHVKVSLKDSSLLVDTNVKLKDAYLNPSSEVLRLTRAGDIVRGTIPNEPNDTWTVFTSNHSTYEPIAFATKDVNSEHPKSLNLVQNHPLVTVVQDRGELDGIRRVLFGGGLKFWLHKLLILDAISYLSRGRLSVSLKRFILVDVDDIFVGEKGTRLRQADVEAILRSQEELRRMIPGFKFNMGFSGKYFHNGDDEENSGDDLLIANSDKFMWFGHMWNHIQPHLYSNLTQLKGDMQRNKDFAKEHGIPVTSGYSVSPHHSGVYPVHEPLYEAWKKVWNIKVTSTEEYPHLRPARLRRGFIHRNIMVLPRQTCGLFTHTIFIDLYPGGRAKLEESIFGGELFQTIVFNTVNVFMTHMSNYGNDRLGLYTFESVTRYLNCWTNLQLVTLPPDRLAEKYFKMHPDELDPIWGNPCDDQRHKKIWSSNNTCEAFPQFLVVGPQKTGTTALYSFLSLHPSISSNTPSPETFEEVQFFNGKNYYKGLDWYMKYFVPENLTTAGNETITNNETIEPIKKSILFEKSATYFDNELVPRRAHALLPKAKIIVLMISPAKRAYSWYQHMRAHKDPTAMNYTFYDILTAPSTAPKNLRDLKNRCLNPGRYAQHIDRWLSYYPSQQILILDGDELKHDPVTIMNRVQQFLQITPAFDYSSKLRYDEKKGFYCQVVNASKNKCLGRGKGRHYDQMDPKAAKFLQTYYLQHNSVLMKLLKRLDVPTPQWLKEDLSLNV